MPALSGAKSCMYSYYIVGSNDGSTWNVVDYRNEQTQAGVITFTPTNATNSYNKFRIIGLQTNGDGFIAIQSLNLNGDIYQKQ